MKRWRGSGIPSSANEYIDCAELCAIVEEYEDAMREGPDEGGEIQLPFEPHVYELLRPLADEVRDLKGDRNEEQLIREDCFVDHMKNEVEDVYPNFPCESHEWPWRHVTVDWEGLAEEAEQDYTRIDFDGATYLLRDC